MTTPIRHPADLADLVEPDDFALFVPGRPAPQGSKRYLGRAGGKGITVESSKAVAPWRADIREQILIALADPGTYGQHDTPLTGPLHVEISFTMPRPASTPKTRTPPAVKRPDLDKLARAVLDAVGSAGLWVDDSQVTRMLCDKRIAGIGETPGAMIRIRRATP